MPKRRFNISAFKNPSGETAYRVSGYLNGKQIRRNFQRKRDAISMRDELEITYLNEEPVGNMLFSTLSPDQNRDAENALQKLKQADSPARLTEAVEYYLAHYRAVAKDTPLEDAVSAYIELREQDHAKGLLSMSHLKSIRTELKILKRACAGKTLTAITEDTIQGYMEAPPIRGMNAKMKEKKPPSPKSWNNRRGILNHFFEYCLFKKLIGQNPVQNIRKLRIKQVRSFAETISAEQAKDLMAFLETYRGLEYKKRKLIYEPGFLVPYFALALFAGIRPDWEDGEITRFRPEHVNFDTNVIHITPEVSKVNEVRNIKLQPNLRAWLEKYPIPENGAVPRINAQNILTEVKKKFSLGHDVLRHTFISMTVGAFRSIGDAALQAGNSEAIIRKHYLDLKSIEESDTFWGIVPSGTILPAFSKQDGRYVMDAQSFVFESERCNAAPVRPEQQKH